MALKFKATKRVAVPLQCGWCEQIKVGTTWMLTVEQFTGADIYEGSAQNAGQIFSWIPCPRSIARGDDLHLARLPFYSRFLNGDQSH